MYIETGNPISGKVKLSIINYQLSIINYQLSIINYQLSITNYDSVFASVHEF